MFSFVRQNGPWLAVGGLLTFGSSFGQTFYISLFAAEIQGSFGLSHGQWGGIYAVATLTSAAVMIWAGMLTDVFRVRVLTPVTWSLLALACLWLAVAQTAWMLLPIVFLLRLAGQGMSTHIAVVAMSRWFAASRGTALAISGMGFSIGEALLPILVVFALTLVAWQTVWVASAVLIVALTPVVFSLLGKERTPQSLAQETASLGMGARHWTRRDVTRHWLFWIMMPALLGPPAFQTAFFFHQVHYAKTVGIGHLQFVQFFPMYTGIAIASALMFGAALDRLGTRALIPFHQIPVMLGFFTFALADSAWTVGLGFALIGLTAGATNTLTTAFWAEYFGTEHLGAIKSLAIAIMVLGSAIGPGLTGVLIDAGIALWMQYIAVGGYFAATTLMLVIGFARAPRLSPAS